MPGRPVFPARVLPLAAILALVVASAGVPAAARAEATIGVYFDAEGNRTYLTCHQSPEMWLPLYVLATGADQMIGGVAFRLEVVGELYVLQTFYRPGVQIGSLLQGVQAGFTQCAYSPGDQPLLIATATAWKPALVDYARLRILPYPPAGAVQMSDCYGILRTVAGNVAYILDPIPVEAQTWGAIKALYGPG